MTLDTQLCFALVAASRAMTSCYRPLLTPLGLTHPQYLAMLVLWERRSMAVGELGDRLQLRSATLSPILVRLEEAGFISRRRSSSDARSVVVHLTPAGARLREAVEVVPPQLARATGMTPAEIASLRDVLQVLTMRLRAAELRPSESVEPS
ncbi:MAG: MarR family transcriptional regulator [Pseudonocardia sp.]|nr:MarR family transcriptional regulator [Pseudonocardia sp.]